jgi:lipoprotein-anchoring transpeptidase ErfK/SrfK
VTPTPTITSTPRPNISWTYTTNPEDLADEGRWINVDISNQRVTAYEGAEPQASFIVSTGTVYHPTVEGQFRIWIKLRATDMAGPGYYLPGVPFTMYFYKGYALHGTYWHDNFGTPMSHGCVNLESHDAEWLFEFATVGTLVNVHP